MVAAPAVSCFGKKKTATAVANAKEGKGLIRVNGQPLSLVEPETLRWKIYEPLLVVGEDKFSTVDIRCRVSGGGHVSQIYALRQAIAKALVAYYAKYYDAASALELRQLFVSYDRTLLIADTRRMEPKKFGGRGARARRAYRADGKDCWPLPVFVSRGEHADARRFPFHVSAIQGRSRTVKVFDGRDVALLHETVRAWRPSRLRRSGSVHRSLSTNAAHPRPGHDCSPLRPRHSSFFCIFIWAHLHTHTHVFLALSPILRGCGRQNRHGHWP